MEKPRLLIIEDNEGQRTGMKWGLERDFEVELADDRPSALLALERLHPDLVTLDLGLPPDANGVEEGFRALDEILAQSPAAKVVVITARDEREHALRAIGRGAHDYFQKPIIDIEELRQALRRALHVNQLEREYLELQRLATGEPLEGMLGNSPGMQKVFSAVRKVAVTDAPVLVLGESGCGKELVARAVHARSPRRDGPFVVINCGAIPENLLESELFGHEKGAFTGAHIQRRGRVETAAHGTLFLDEIGELPLALQVKLLRFLQERRIERVGGREEIDVDARVVAATNVDLKQAIAGGRFREDLFYRLGVVTIAVPPLRERGADIALIARAFLERYAGEGRKRIAGFAAAAARAIETYDWPGNIRELENRVRRAVIMADGPSLTVDDLELGDVRSAARPLRKARAEMEKEVVEQALARHGGNISRAAAELGVSRPTLYALLDRLGLRR